MELAETHKVERPFCGPKSNHQALWGSGKHQTGEGFALPETNGKSKSAPKLTDDASHTMTRSGGNFLAPNGPWSDSAIVLWWREGDKSHHHQYEHEGFQGGTAKWYDVSQDGAYTRIEQDYVNLGSEYGPELFWRLRWTDGGPPEAGIAGPSRWGDRFALAYKDSGFGFLAQILNARWIFLA